MVVSHERVCNSPTPPGSAAGGLPLRLAASEQTTRNRREVLDDRDDMVVKAMSWTLRELAKRNPTAVKGFVQKEERRSPFRPPPANPPTVRLVISIEGPPQCGLLIPHDKQVGGGEEQAGITE
jgi:hypothetical protein